MKQTVHLLITGKVQGVFFRAGAAAMAKKLNLNGWIRNTEEGAVEATINGPQQSVEKFIEWCRQGPEQAVVSHVAVTPKPDDGLSGFEVLK